LKPFIEWTGRAEALVEGRSEGASNPVKVGAIVASRVLGRRLLRAGAFHIVKPLINLGGLNEDMKVSVVTDF
jgi:hypothetical protein